MERLEIEGIEGDVDSDNIPSTSSISSDNDSDDEAHEEAAVEKSESDLKEAVQIFHDQRQKRQQEICEVFYGLTSKDTSPC